MGRWVVLGWAACLGYVTLIVVLIGQSSGGALIDLQVYRVGGSAWLDGIPLYTTIFPVHLPFTYPPVSAVMFSVLSVVSWPVAIVLITVAGLLALSATVMLAAPTPTRRALPVAAAAVGVGWFALEPVRDTLTFGQVNLVLMGLVALDCLLPRTRYPRGMLIGVAAALKLTPLFFVAFFLARRQFGPAATAVGTFIGVTGLAALVAPSDSHTYWTSTIFQTDRIGGAAFATNQSVRGALTRLDLAPGVVQAGWLVLLVVVLVLAWIGARRALRVGDQVGALLVVAAAGLVVSPVSWSHHWVWIAPALVIGWFWVYRRRAVLPAVGLALVTAVFAAGNRFLPHADDLELQWAWWQHLIGNGYLIIALAFLGWSATARRSSADGMEPVLPALTLRRSGSAGEPASG